MYITSKCKTELKPPTLEVEYTYNIGNINITKIHKVKDGKLKSSPTHLKFEER